MYVETLINLGRLIVGYSVLEDKLGFYHFATTKGLQKYVAH